ncbi:MAG: hypothetical protein HQM09_00235 [Candidatus Riflebacteria bacterium]|nr:hypothetical protein [Candidatus Riflebacteria bacterium]
MKSSRRGFTLIVTFMVTTVLFIFVLGAADLVRANLDLSRSSLLETVAFHAADGGLERGLARLRNHPFAPFKLAYSVDLGGLRKADVQIEAVQTPVENTATGSSSGTNEGISGTSASFSIDLIVNTVIREGGRLSARKKLSRKGILDLPGRQACGRFSEES